MTRRQLKKKYKKLQKCLFSCYSLLSSKMAIKGIEKDASFLKDFEEITKIVMKDVRSDE